MKEPEPVSLRSGVIDTGQARSAVKAVTDSEAKELTKLVTSLKAFVADESGATMVEYAIMGGLTASLLVLAILGVSDLLADAWTYLAATLLGETPFAI